jgi:hypothetical protein
MGRIEPYLPRTPGLGENGSLAEIGEGGLIPGRQGVTLTDRTVRFGDLYHLTERTGIEYALTRETLRGERVFRLYSGGHNAVTTPKRPGVRVIGHTHPGGNCYPSGVDMRALNEGFLEAVETDPFAPVPHERVIYGPGDRESTIYYANILR